MTKSTVRVVQPSTEIEYTYGRVLPMLRLKR